MVVTEVGHIIEVVSIDIFSPFSIVIPYVVHILLVEERISDSEKERIIQAGVQ
jgi:hypothetical protein